MAQTSAKISPPQTKNPGYVPAWRGLLLKSHKGSHLLHIVTYSLHISFLQSLKTIKLQLFYSSYNLSPPFMRNIKLEGA